MRARIGAGIAGWFVSLVPTLAVNAAAYTGILGYQEAALANAVAFFGGLLLGGVVAGRLGARAGIAGAAQAGGITAALYAVSLVGLILGVGSIKTSFLFADAPLAVAGAVAFLALIQLGAALLTGAVAGRAAVQAPAPRAPQSRPRPVYADPRGYAQRPPSVPQRRGPYDSGPRVQGSERADRGGRGDDAVYAGRRRSGEWDEWGDTSDRAQRRQNPRP